MKTPQQRLNKTPQQHLNKIAKLTPRQFGELIKRASIDEEKAANWLHSIGDRVDSLGQGMYDTGASVNRGVRNFANNAYNYGQSLWRMPGEIFGAIGKGFTGGLGDQKDYFGTGDYAAGREKQRQMGVQRPTGGNYVNPTPAPRPAAPPPAPAAAAPAPQPAAPAAAPAAPAAAPAPAPAAPAPRPAAPAPAPRPAAPAPAPAGPASGTGGNFGVPQRAPGWNKR